MKTKFLKIFISIFTALTLIVTTSLLSLYYNIPENKVENAKLHFSIDDTIQIFNDLTTNADNYTSIFDNYFLYSLKKLNDKYGAIFSLYCYYEQDDFNLSMVPDKYKDEFFNNSDWLKFGFHSLNADSDLNTISADEIAKDYTLVKNELMRITGSLTTTLRLSYFEGNYDAVTTLKDLGVTSLLTADDDRLCYYFNEETRSYIDTHDEFTDTNNNMNFVSTDLRLDNLRNILVYYNLIKINRDTEQNQIISVFTHEWLLDDNMLNKIETVCKFANNYEYSFTFLE